MIPRSVVSPYVDRPDRKRVARDTNASTLAELEAAREALPGVTRVDLSSGERKKIRARARRNGVEAHEQLQDDLLLRGFRCSERCAKGAMK